MSQSIREENNPVYHTNHPEEQTSPGQNEDQNVLHAESTTAEPTRISTCGQNSPSSQGQDRLEATYVASNEVEHTRTNEHYYIAPSSQGQDRLEATYVAGNEVEHTSTNEHYYIADKNEISTRTVTDEYSVSDPIHAKNSAPVEDVEDGNATENSEEEQENTENVMQEDSTVTADGDIEPYAVTNICHQETYFNATTNVYQQTSRNADGEVTDNGDIEPYAVANISDHMAYLSRTNMRQQASDNSRHDTSIHKLCNPANADGNATDDGDMEPYAVTNMYENENYLSATTNVPQQASANSRSDTTQHVNKHHNPPTKLVPNPMYVPNLQQVNKLCGKMTDIHFVNLCFMTL
ncbi:uncharacterized protein LOC144926641 [Branchiostoma floridae x Branchiostoma belcheri]